MAAVSAVDLLQRSEALIDGKKINEAIDILNGLGMCVIISCHPVRAKRCSDSN